MKHPKIRVTIGAGAAAVVIGVFCVVPLPAQAADTRCFGRTPTITGTGADDSIDGTAGEDVIIGLGGDDTIRGLGGQDLVCGGRGDDRIKGGTGDDTIRGGPGADRLSGGRGSDRLWGMAGRDRVRGGHGADRLRGGAGPDRARGGPGLDLCLSPTPPTARGCENTSRVSVSSKGRQGNNHSGSTAQAISSDGRYVVFASRASNLVRGDTNEKWDVFVRDRRTRTTTRVSVSSSGLQGNRRSLFGLGISPNGRYVTFDSNASNLVAGDTNGTQDAFVHDMATGQTSRVSVASGGSQARGGFNSFSGTPAISEDGRYVAFASGASLVPGDTNGNGDVFVHDRQTGATSRVSVASDGSQTVSRSISYGAAISGTGRYVSFHSDANDLVPGDTNGTFDVFLHDTLTGVTRRVSVSSNGGQANDTSNWSMVSANGRYVTLGSDATNLVSGDTNERPDLFVHDMVTGVTSRVSVGSDGRQLHRGGGGGAMSADGRFIVLNTDAKNVVAGDRNGGVFVHDMLTGANRRASVTSDGEQDMRAGGGAISGDGRAVAFFSSASNVVPGDTNGRDDMFVRIMR